MPSQQRDLDLADLQTESADDLGDQEQHLAREAGSIGALS
jgi:hypothetical protein